MRFNLGQNVTLKESYLGYCSGEIVGYEHPQYQVELSSGKVISLYADEIES